MHHFEVDIIDKWPRLKIIVNSPAGVKTAESLHDTAITNFEVVVKNTLQQTVNEIIQRRKK